MAVDIGRRIKEPRILRKKILKPKEVVTEAVEGEEGLPGDSQVWSPLSILVEKLGWWDANTSGKTL